MNMLPGWIADPALRPVWDRLLDRLEARGLVAEGKVWIETASRERRHAVGALLGRTVTAERIRVDLAELDRRLIDRSGIGGLLAVLVAVTGRTPRNRVAERVEREEARERPLALAAELLTTEWSAEWVADLRRTGLLTGRADAERVVSDAVMLLREITEGQPRAQSRVELGARLLGDSHALDRDRLLHRVVLRGLAASAGEQMPADARARERLWATYGVAPDLLSRSCLVWGLRASGAGVAERLRLAADSGDPIHLTEWDLRRLGDLQVVEGVRVLVCENPRVLEAVAEQRMGGWATVCTAGEPNLVVDEVLRRLATGADLRYHGDFDWPGVAIANRIITRFGATPWRMGADDYLAAVRADAPALEGAAVEPSWDAELGAAMRARGRVVHEETLLSELLFEMRALTGEI